jgi:hypothetical protein
MLQRLAQLEGRPQLYLMKEYLTENPIEMHPCEGCNVLYCSDGKLIFIQSHI